MGAIDKSDERGHIIASSLGGPAVPWNIFPQAPRMNRGPEPWDHASNAPPTWKQFEGKVRDFLALRGRRTVQYTIHFDYYDRRNPCRPSDVSASANLYDGGRLQRTLGGTYVNDNMNWG
ncbi:unnamed protein product [Allacma fusca]|uniref:Type VII secretion system protein EssD-like domain-containing protein n=1 Tax=Allacma fusca TaxID=39272 RepID=A0A8J2KI25_9HEXA|nr:unnamed protein product [Allacma fusca]